MKVQIVETSMPQLTAIRIKLRDPSSNGEVKGREALTWSSLETSSIWEMQRYIRHRSQVMTCNTYKHRYSGSSRVEVALM